jgi:hypothetical protein
MSACLPFRFHVFQLSRRPAFLFSICPVFQPVWFPSLNVVTEPPRGRPVGGGGVHHFFGGFTDLFDATSAVPSTMGLFNQRTVRPVLNQ